MSKALGAMSRPETTPEEEEEELIFCSLVGVLLRAAPAKKKIIHRSTLSHRKKIQIPSTSAVPGTSIEVLVLANHSTAHRSRHGDYSSQLGNNRRIELGFSPGSGP